MSFDYGKKKEDGQHERHPTSVPEDGKFIRPVRTNYIHVGTPGPKYPLRDLTEKEKELWGGDDLGYFKFEVYPTSESDICNVTGRFWTQKQIDNIGKGCGTVTSMGIRIAETYAANPSFYGKTFCAGCGEYFPVGKDGEFLWIEKDGTTSTERVGT